MKELTYLFVTSVFIVGCSNPLGEGKKGSYLDDFYNPGQPVTVPTTQIPTDVNSPSHSAGSNLNLKGTTLSAGLKIQSKTKKLKGNSLSADVNIK